MTPNYRAICVELIFIWNRSSNPDDLFENMAPLIDRARAALAEPEPVPEGPSKRELLAIELALWDKYRTKGWGGEEFMYDSAFSSALDEYRAVLARWGR